ncbi:hypothetical protein [Paenibacillus apiarius]|nr:hypothetical protein [Paenibacillus apiarius]MEC0117864.1 hypothetical protein [Paenibacillus apiarius]MEC0189908.1 hypothetical protein [Paenibacillus apiarius]
MKNNQMALRKPWNVRWLAAAKAAASVVLFGTHANDARKIQEGA